MSTSRSTIVVLASVEEVEKKEGGGESTVTINQRIQEFIENPMPPEQEARMMRALFQAQLASGELNGNMMTAFEKIIGVSTGEDDTIQVVDFSTAFPTLARAVEVCTQAMPEIDEIS